MTDKKKGTGKAKARLMPDVDGLPSLVEEPRREKKKDPQNVGACMVCGFTHATWKRTKRGIVVHCEVCRSALFLNSNIGMEMWKGATRLQRKLPEVTAAYIEAILHHVSRLADPVKSAIYEAVLYRGPAPPKG